jgi:hypothetical protein
VKAEIQGLVSGTTGTNLYDAWYSQGGRILGCTFGNSYTVGTFTVLPVSGGSDESDVLVGDATEGVVGFSDFTGEILSELSQTSSLLPRVQYGLGTAQLQVLDDGACILLDNYFPANNPVAIPPSVTELITTEANVVGGFPRVVSAPSAGQSGTFVIRLYVATNSTSGFAEAGDLSIAYDAIGKSATLGGTTTLDSDSCPSTIGKLARYANNLEDSVETAHGISNPPPDPSWSLGP